MTPIIGRIQILARAARRPDFQVERLVQGLDQLTWGGSGQEAQSRIGQTPVAVSVSKV
jgi:hypothetical protein